MSNCASEVFFGTYTAGIADNPGIWRSVFDAASGTLSTPEPAAETEQPSWLLFSPDGRLLYAANETEEFREAEGGSVTVFRLRRDGTLRRSSTVASGGVAPCHLSLSGDGHLLFATNYGGTVTVLPLDAFGLPSPAAQQFEHEGSGPLKDRQASAHPHSAVPAPNGKFIHVPDLGADRVYVYEKLGDRLEQRPDLQLQAPAGSGPRHLAWHPDGSSAYLTCELSSTLLHLAPETEEPGRFHINGEYSTLPTGVDTDNWPAEVAVHPRGHALYVSNRGHDSLAVFQLAADGTPELTEVVPGGVQFPRHFALSPCGNWLLAGGQHDGRVTVLRVLEDGSLEPTGNSAEVPAVASIAFRPGAGS